MSTLAVQVQVARPIDYVWNLFHDTSRMGEWVQGFHSIETIEGQGNEVGSVHLLTFSEGKRKIVVNERVVECDPPHRFGMDTSAPGMKTQMRIRFTAEGDGTRIESENCFQATNFVMRLMLPLMKGQIRKRIQADLERFAALAEAEAVTTA